MFIPAWMKLMSRLGRSRGDVSVAAIASVASGLALERRKLTRAHGGTRAR